MRTLQSNSVLARSADEIAVTGPSPASSVTGQSPTSGPHNVDQFLNPAAFNQPCVLGGTASAPKPIIDQPLGCVPLTGLDALGGAATQVAGPGFSRLDFSLFKDFKLTERLRLQFRSEFFNILNHPNFNAPDPAIPGSLDFKSPTFGQIGSTRDAPNDPRQIQFALRLYF